MKTLLLYKENIGLNLTNVDLDNFKKIPIFLNILEEIYDYF